MYQEKNKNERGIDWQRNLWPIMVFGWLAFVSNFSSIFVMLTAFFLIKTFIQVQKQKSYQNIPVFRGPLEARREEQMRKYEQIPSGQRTTSTTKTTPQSSIKANTFKVSGIKKYKEFDLEEAILDFSKGLEVAPNDQALHFNIACAYSLTENKVLAFHHLSRAITLGLKDVEKIMQHDDLAYVRIQPEFDEFRKSGFANNPYKTNTKPTEENPVIRQQDAPILEENEVDNSLLGQLNRISEMRRQGAISEEEFIAERKKLLRQ
jgi:hypothetical protein